MKYINQPLLLTNWVSDTLLLIVMILIIGFSSCKKDQVQLTPFASLTVVNAVYGGTGVKLGSRLQTISNNRSAQLALNTGENNLYVWPVGDSLHPYFVQNKFIAKDREIYSLFVCGIPGATEGIIVKDDLFYRTDSTAGIRFINLAPNTNSKPISITMLATPTVNEVSNLTYRQYTEFKTYSAFASSAYTFQIRNDTCLSPKPPLATFAFAASQVPRFANITLVIRQNGTGLAIFRVNNDR